MKATQQLKDEHEGIRAMLNILEKISEQLERTGTIEKEHFDGILEFLETFVDRCHHAKEEGVLFPEMIALTDEAKAPTAAMHAEHDTGRVYVGSMSRAYAAYVQGDVPSSTGITENARAYVSLLRDHIVKENDVLLEVVDKIFSDEKQNELFERFERIEEERIGHGKHEEFHGLLDKLSAIYMQTDHHRER